MNENTYLYHRNFANEGDYAFPIPSPVSQGVRPQIDWPNNNNKKIGVTPGAVVGALVGASLAKHKVEKDLKTKEMRESALKSNQSPSIDGNYYSQVKNIHDNLEVIFTPMSAVFVINNKKNKFTLDTIETSEMTPSMKNAWKSKNSSFFKELLLTKMLSEMQIAEEGFTKSFIKKQLFVDDELNKKANDTSFLDNISNVDLFFRSKIYNSFGCSEFGEKIASAIADDITLEDDIQYINLEFERPLDKYAGVVTGVKDCLGIHSSVDDLSKIKKRLENPKKIMREIKVGFFPDRVIFTLDNQLISTLPLLGMNEEGYEHFKNQDTKYFRNIFISDVKSSIKNKKADSMVNIEYIEKTAGQDISEFQSSENCLLQSDTHPVVIYLFLTSKLGLEWLKFDITIIEKIIKSEFNIVEIPDTTLNKIFTILAANQSLSIYTIPYAFEKAVLSLCSKPIEFFDNEKESVKMQDLSFAIDVLDRITPFDDIYDNFSEDVVSYMCDVLSEQDLYCYSPTSIIGSPNEPTFNEILNKHLLKSIKGKMTIDSNGPGIDNEIFEKCDFVFDNTLMLLNSIRRYLIENPNLDISKFNIGDLIDSIIKKRGLSENQLKNIIRTQIIKNLALDNVLDLYNKGLQDQLQKYNILSLKGE